MAMIDFVKKINKHCADDLEPAKRCSRHSVSHRGDPTTGRMGAISGAVGALTGDALANQRIKDSDQRTGEGITVEIPAGKAVLGLSGSQRLLVFGHSAMSGRPKGLSRVDPARADPIDRCRSGQARRQDVDHLHRWHLGRLRRRERPARVRSQTSSPN
ncbi:MAG: hypothetical protein R2789_09845 [Microthrixaceae bacterium]